MSSPNINGSSGADTSPLLIDWLKRWWKWALVIAALLVVCLWFICYQLNRPIGTAFSDAGRAYNLTTLFLDALGLLGTVVGFYIAFVQIQRAVSAAEAASAASMRTLAAARQVTSVVDIAALQRLAATALAHMNARNWPVAGAVALELRGTVISVMQAPGADQLQTKKKWGEMLKAVQDVHEGLEAYPADNQATNVMQAHTRTMFKIKDAIDTLGSQAASRVETDYANPK